MGFFAYAQGYPAIATLQAQWQMIFKVAMQQAVYRT
jgi:hypothetical protein